MMSGFPYGANTGAIAIRWLGAWSSETAYVVGDSVSRGGSSYVAREASTDVEPGVDEGWADSWQLVASKGDAGPTGATGPAGPAGEGGGVEWLTASGSGMTSVADSWVTLASIALPDGWLEAGASVEYLAEAFCGLNSNSVAMIFRVVLANSGGTVLATIGQMESSFMDPYTTAQGVTIEGGATIAIVELNARVQRFVARTSGSVDSAASYVETGTLAGAARIAIQAMSGVENAGNVNLVKFRAMVS